MSLARLCAASALALAAALPLGAQEAAPAVPAPEAVTPASPDTVVATVNGQPLTLADLGAVLAELPQQYLSLPDDALYDGLRQQLVDQRVLAAAAEASGVAEHPVVARALALQRQGLLADFLLRAEIAKRVTEEAVAQAYEAQYAKAEPVPEVRASHILVPTQEAAMELKKQIDGGADFAALAAEHGTDGTKTRGGDLGWFSREMMVPEFADAAFAMAEGAVSDPVQSQFGWHLIKLTGKRDQPVPPLEEVRAEIESALGTAAAREALEALRAAATVETPEGRPGAQSLRDPSFLAFP